MNKLFQYIGLFFLVWIISYVHPFPTAYAQAQEVVYHRVQPGETLFSIAQKYGLTLQEIKALNQLTSDKIIIGQKLIVKKNPKTNQQPPSNTTTTIHEVQPGETLFSIAFQYGILVDSLLARNPTIRTVLEPGQKLILPPLPTRTQTITHVVKPGETLFKIAQKYNLSLKELRRTNRLKNDQIYVGQKLKIPHQKKTAGASPSTPILKGPVNIYPETFIGRLTASGERYDPEAFTASHPSLPFGTILLLVNPATGSKIFVRVNDRGPWDKGVILDISAAAARQLNLTEPGVHPIEVYRVH